MFIWYTLGFHHLVTMLAMDTFAEVRLEPTCAKLGRMKEKKRLLRSETFIDLRKRGASPNAPKCRGTNSIHIIKYVLPTDMFYLSATFVLLIGRANTFV